MEAWARRSMQAKPEREPCLPPPPSRSVPAAASHPPMPSVARRCCKAWSRCASGRACTSAVQGSAACTTWCMRFWTMRLTRCRQGLPQVRRGCPPTGPMPPAPPASPYARCRLAARAWRSDWPCLLFRAAMCCCSRSCSLPAVFLPAHPPACPPACLPTCCLPTCLPCCPAAEVHVELNLDTGWVTISDNGRWGWLWLSAAGRPRRARAAAAAACGCPSLAGQHAPLGLHRAALHTGASQPTCTQSLESRRWRRY